MTVVWRGLNSQSECLVHVFNLHFPLYVLLFYVFDLVPHICGYPSKHVSYYRINFTHGRMWNIKSECEILACCLWNCTPVGSKTRSKWHWVPESWLEWLIPCVGFLLDISFFMINAPRILCNVLFRRVDVLVKSAYYLCHVRTPIRTCQRGSKTLTDFH